SRAVENMKPTRTTAATKTKKIVKGTEPSNSKAGKPIKASLKTKTKQAKAQGVRNGADRPQSGETHDQLTARAARLSAALHKLYPEARISLDFETAWQCLVATILSAQCTDERVNRVTPELFRKIPDVAAMADAPSEEIQRLIATTGFFRQKTKSLQ